MFFTSFILVHSRRLAVSGSSFQMNTNSCLSKCSTTASHGLSPPHLLMSPGSLLNQLFIPIVSRLCYLPPLLILIVALVRVFNWRQKSELLFSQANRKLDFVISFENFWECWRTRLGWENARVAQDRPSKKSFHQLPQLTLQSIQQKSCCSSLERSTCSPDTTRFLAPPVDRHVWDSPGMSVN